MNYLDSLNASITNLWNRPASRHRPKPVETMACGAVALQEENGFLTDGINREVR